MTCDICDFAGASIGCAIHPMMGGKNKMAQMVKDLHQAMLGGQSWGNIICDAEEEVLASMSAAQKAELEIKKIADEKLRAEKVTHYAIDKRKKLYTNQTTGLAPIRFGRHCKKERYHGELCRNKMMASTASCDPKHGCGCRLHNERKGACSFVHDDEEEEMAILFKNNGMKMLDDKAFIAKLIKIDQLKEKANANPNARYVLEKEMRALEIETNVMEDRFKAEQRKSKLWQTVNANGTVSYSRTQPDSDGHSSRSSGQGSTDKQRHNTFFKKADNSVW